MEPENSLQDDSPVESELETRVEEVTAIETKYNG